MGIEINERALSVELDKLTSNAIDEIAQYVSDDSRYLMFVWDASEGNLQIGLSDHDSKEKYRLLVEKRWEKLAFQEGSNSALETEELIRFCLTDYLSSCNGFLRYALIALFHTGDAAKSRLL